MRLRMPNTKDLSEKAEAYNRKVWKRDLIKMIKAVRKAIKSKSKKGMGFYSFTSDDNRTDRHWDNMVLFRWYRRYSGLNVNIGEDDVIETKQGHKYVGIIYVNIKW